jgi:hypothetical protein
MRRSIWVLAFVVLELEELLPPPITRAPCHRHVRFRGSRAVPACGACRAGGQELLAETAAGAARRHDYELVPVETQHDGANALPVAHAWHEHGAQVAHLAREPGQELRLDRGRKMRQRGRVELMGDGLVVVGRRHLPRLVMSSTTTSSTAPPIISGTMLAAPVAPTLGDDDDDAPAPTANGDAIQDD